MSKFLLIFILLLGIEIAYSSPWHDSIDHNNPSDALTINPFSNKYNDTESQYYGHKKNRWHTKNKHNKTRYYYDLNANDDVVDFNGGIFFMLFGLFFPVVCCCGPCVLCIGYVVVKFVNSRQKKKEEELRLRIAALRNLENQRQQQPGPGQIQPVFYQNPNPIIFPTNEITLESLNSQ